MKHNLELRTNTQESFEPREFSVKEKVNELFEVDLVVTAMNPTIDFDAIVGHPASFRIHIGNTGVRSWNGLCSRLDQVRTDATGLSTYRMGIVPPMWLLTQRRNYRMFQQQSEIDIVLQVLAEWHIEPVVRLDKSSYKKRAYRVQYAESDYSFVCRTLEGAGITFFFEQVDEQVQLVLTDTPHLAEPRTIPLRYHDNPNRPQETSVITSVRLGQKVRPGRYTVRDNDARLPPNYPLMASARVGEGQIDDLLERYHYVPGAFLFETEKGEDTPVADDRGKYRSDHVEANRLTEKRLRAKRGNMRVCTFETNAHDLTPGMIVRVVDHPHGLLAPEKTQFVLQSEFFGKQEGEWTQRCEITSAAVPYHPPLKTTKPWAAGLESATVVGPPGEEIHTDEFGRVRVHFHWDRYDRMDHKSSCWIPVSQSWAGAGFGGICLPRVGQEVLVGFLGGDPDRPIVVGRVFTAAQAVPYGLPANKTQSAWKSASSPGGGGYNEIMFEDAKGSELIRMQAEKNMNKLVKNDESNQVGHDRSTSVGHDDDLVVGNDRSKTVQMNEREICGMNRSRVVGLNESAEIGGSQTLNVAKGSAETVGLGKALSVGLAYQVSVGAAMNTTVALTNTEQVGHFKNVQVGRKYQFECGDVSVTRKKDGEAIEKSKTHLIEATESITFKCGEAKIILKKDGSVGIQGKTIGIRATETLQMFGDGDLVLTTPDALVNAGKVTIEGGSGVVINAKVIDLNNPK
jgi:type VI secretion system secreted protein VgrG